MNTQAIGTWVFTAYLSALAGCGLASEGEEPPPEFGEDAAEDTPQPETGRDAKPDKRDAEASLPEGRTSPEASVGEEDDAAEDVILSDADADAEFAPEVVAEAEDGDATVAPDGGDVVETGADQSTEVVADQSSETPADAGGDTVVDAATDESSLPDKYVPPSDASDVKTDAGCMTAGGGTPGFRFKWYSAANWTPKRLDAEIDKPPLGSPDVPWTTGICTDTNAQPNVWDCYISATSLPCGSTVTLNILIDDGTPKGSFMCNTQGCIGFPGEYVAWNQGQPVPNPANFAVVTQSGCDAGPCLHLLKITVP